MRAIVQRKYFPSLKWRELPLQTFGRGTSDLNLTARDFSPSILIRTPRINQNKVEDFGKIALFSIKMDTEIPIDATDMNGLCRLCLEKSLHMENINNIEKMSEKLQNFLQIEVIFQIFGDYSSFIPYPCRQLSMIDGPRSYVTCVSPKYMIGRLSTKLYRIIRRFWGKVLVASQMGIISPIWCTRSSVYRRLSI